VCVVGNVCPGYVYETNLVTNCNLV